MVHSVCASPSGIRAIGSSASAANGGYVNGIANTVWNAYRFSPAPAVPPAPWYTSMSFSRSSGGASRTGTTGTSPATAGTDHAHREWRNQCHSPAAGDGTGGRGTGGAGATGGGASSRARPASAAASIADPIATPPSPSVNQCTPT
jgi:hypothetical protein